MAKSRMSFDSPAQERGVFWTPFIVGEDLAGAYKERHIVNNEERPASLIEHGAKVGSAVLLKSLLEHGVEISGELLESKAFKATLEENAQNAAIETKRIISAPTVAS